MSLPVAIILGVVALVVLLKLALPDRACARLGRGGVRVLRRGEADKAGPMTPFDHLLPPREDDLDYRFAVALRDLPAGERVMQAKIWKMLRDIERSVDQVHADLRDCDIIMARTIDTIQRFNATEPYRG